MSSVLEKIQEETKTLSAEDKTSLAIFLWESLHEMTPEADTYWRSEMKRRAAEYTAGKTKLIPLEEIRSRYADFEKNLPK